MRASQKKIITSSFDLRQSPEYKKYAKKIVTERFERIKINFINKFNQHPVTREVLAGPRSSNLSGTLGGVGNLFSFIGFEARQKPIDGVRPLFNKMFLTSIQIKKDGSFICFASYPKLKDYYQATPLPWATGKSWMEGIERGISNLGFFLNQKSEKSRSGQGLQASNKINKISFQKTPYMSKLINEFEAEILKLNQTTI